MIKVFNYLKNYRLTMFIAWGLMLIELVVELWHPLLMAKIIDDGIMKEDLSVVLFFGGVMLGLSLLAFLAGVTNSFYASHVSQGFGYDIRRDLFTKIQSFSFGNFNKFPTSSLVTRMTNDVTLIQNTIFMGLRIMARAPLLIIFGTVMALFIDVKLALIFVIIVPLLTAFFLWVMRKAGALFQTVQNKLDKVNNVLQENLSGMRIIKAFLRRKHEIGRFTRASNELTERTIKTFRIIETTMPILLLVMNMSIIVILWFGFFDVNNGDIEVGKVVAIINYAMRITVAISMLSFITMAFSRASASSERIFDVLETEIDLNDSLNVDSTLTIKEGKIQFNRVSFSYPGSEATVLKDISFEAQSGETVAILGETGSGKSSLFQLIPRLYDVKGGAIYIDGLDITDMKQTMLREKIGYVPQEALLFTGTIQENIAWGKEEATLEEVIKAAQDAQIHRTITELPNQYSTRVGQKGVNLSGGQKQRLSIARALVRKPKILLMDDSTSALDLKTEAELFKSLKKYTCTTLIITQKISTAMEADKILLIQNGELLTEGSHDFLIKHSDLYQQIFTSQFGEEKLRNAQRNN